jgi:hypothetical protein
MFLSSRQLAGILAAVAVTGCATESTSPELARSQPAFASIDIHTHTNFTDGTHTQADVLTNALGTYKLDMMANSEHGGTSAKDALGAPFVAGFAKGDSATATNGPVRDSVTGVAGSIVVTSNNVWRWQVLRDLSWPLLFDKTTGLALTYPKQAIIQGVEWNVPTHEHASVGIVGVTTGRAVSDFEYQFDASDKDASRSSGAVLTLNNTAGATAATSTAAAPEIDIFGTALAKKYKTHLDSLAGAAYLQKNFKDTSYVVINHPSRRQSYSVSDFRDLMQAGPDVVVGLEGFPGHQKETCRGGYGSVFVGDDAKTARARTYGGADFMLAKVGGLMDSLWAEGRRFWVFVNSDFHTYADNADFWPGQYAKTWIGAASKSAGDIVKGMKAGNIFAVQGDLINALDFRAVGQPPPGNTLGVSAFMGESVDFAKSSVVTLRVRMKSPGTNANGDAVAVDHVDVIVGSQVTRAVLGESGYTKETSDAAVVKTLKKGDFTVDADGFLTAETTLVLDKSKYVRLRGTNLAIPAADTDPDITASGDPKMDDTLLADCINTPAATWKDLWFYSNPIFLNAK